MAAPIKIRQDENGDTVVELESGETMDDIYNDIINGSAFE